MRDLVAVLRPWLRQSGWLLLGLAAALLSVAASAGLLIGAGVLAAGGDAAAEAGSLVAALALPSALRALGVGRVVLRYLERLAVHSAMFRTLAEVRVRLFRDVAAGAAGGLGYRHAGDLASSLVSDVQALDVVFPRIVVPLAGAALLLPVLLWATLRASPVAAAGAAVLYALAAGVIPAWNARAAQAASAELAAALSRVRVAVLDALNGLPEIRAYGAQGQAMRRMEWEDDALLRAQRRSTSQAAGADAVALLCAQAATLLVAAAGSPLDGALLPALFATSAAFEVVAGLPRAGVLAGQAAQAARRLRSVASVAPLSGPLPAAALPAGPVAPGAASLRFQDVGFRWSTDRPPVFDGLSLRIEAGSRVAVLGPSGSGKSTLAALALRIVQPQSGQVLLAGTPVEAFDLPSLRGSVAYLSQATHVFDDTVRANLLLGRTGASDAELWDVLNQAAAADVVRALPDGLDAWLGEGGLRLSGGQRRRIALARTLLSQAPVLILDEPGAGLDRDTERAFLRALFGDTRPRTVLLIAHRLLGVEKLDRIWRLQGGQAVSAAG